MKRIKGFTLAEVLITLVVIGIIAAITVPVIMANHRKTETASRLKKFYATMSNAIKLAEMEHGTKSYEWGCPTCGDFEAEKEWFEKYLAKYINYTKIEKMSENAERMKLHKEMGLITGGAAIYLNDGSLMFSSECLDNVAYDVNGDKGPNEFGRDIFVFFIITYDDNGNANDIIDNIPRFNTISFNPIPWENNEQMLKTNYNREKSLEQCKTDSGRTWGHCTRLIELDGWEIKNDYPWKI